MDTKKVPKNISKFSYCYGCGICYISCPNNAISFRLKDGFFQPFIKTSACTNCGICLKSCSFEQFTTPCPSISYGAYSVWSNNDFVRTTSTSGGILFEICRKAISLGYKIIGVRYDYKKNMAVHYIFNTIDDLSYATGSKYLQSYSLDALTQLEPDEHYVVIGVPCMIASLRSYLKNKKIESNYLLIDFFCHGVPSYTFYWKYLKYLSGKIGNVKSIKFRSKRKGWQNSTAVEVVGSNGEYFNTMSNGDLFYSFFLGDRCLNKVCYDNCCFKSTSSLADLRVGDFWGRKYNDNKLGINSVISFTSKGEHILECIKDSCSVNKEYLNDVISGQMKSNAKRPASFKLVQFLININCPLSLIALLSDLIDGIVSLPHRVVFLKQRLAQIKLIK